MLFLVVFQICQALATSTQLAFQAFVVSLSDI